MLGFFINEIYIIYIVIIIKIAIIRFFGIFENSFKDSRADLRKYINTI